MESNTESSNPEMLTLAQLATMLVQHHDFHEGLYEVAVELQIAVGKVGPTPGNAMPGAMVGISRVGLVKAEKMGPYTVDASAVNPGKGSPKPKPAPAKKPRKAKTA